MATWPATTPISALLLQNTDTSTDLGGFGLDNGVRGQQGSQIETTAGNTAHQPTTISHEVPTTQPTFKAIGAGDQIFERIHVLPATKVLPFLLSTQVIQIEVWNAFRDLPETVSSITIDGPVGLSILTTYVLPLTWPPFTSKVFNAQLLASGPPQADNTIHWDFDGIAEPLFHVTALRLLPFTISPDWAQGIDDVPSWLTDVMTAYDDTEQRMSLRVFPNRSVSYVAMALDEREAGLMDSLLWAWQSRSFGVPLWMDRGLMSADAPAGSLVIACDTTNMTLVDNVDTVILFTDAFTWFASPVVAHTSTSITLGTPTDKDFAAADSTVIPVVLGRITDKLPVSRPNTSSASAQIKFDLQTARLS